MKVLKCSKQNVYQPMPTGKGAKTITIPFSLCLHTVHVKKNQAKQNRKQLITRIMFILMTIRTSHQCKIKHLLKCSLMKSWPWKQRIPMKKYFAFKSALVSKRRDWLLSVQAYHNIPNRPWTMRDRHKVTFIFSGNNGKSTWIRIEKCGENM